MIRISSFLFNFFSSSGSIESSCPYLSNASAYRSPYCCLTSSIGSIVSSPVLLAATVSSTCALNSLSAVSTVSSFQGILSSSEAILLHGNCLIIYTLRIRVDGGERATRITLPTLECLPRSLSGVFQCAPDGTPDRGLITPRAAKNAITG